MDVAALRRTAIALAARHGWPARRWLQPAKLSGYNADIRESSVSGISSGAFMAVQFGTAWSSVIRGVGVVAGGPYWCAKAQWISSRLLVCRLNATGVCMSGPLAGPQPNSSPRPMPNRLPARSIRWSWCAGRRSTCSTAIMMTGWRGRSPMRRRISIATISARPTAATSSTRPRSAPVIRWSSHRIRRVDRSQRMRDKRRPVYRPVRLRSGRNHPAAHLRCVESLRSRGH